MNNSTQNKVLKLRISEELENLIGERLKEINSQKELFWQDNLTKSEYVRNLILKDLGIKDGL